MPNKKSRAKRARSLDFELAPTELAKTTNLSSKKSRLRSKRLRQGKDAFETEDDTPKAFVRLMAWTSGAKQYPKDLDDGNSKPLSSSSSSSSPKSKKRKRDDTGKDPGEGSAREDNEKLSDLKIRPNETLTHFNRRVDATLPIRMKTGRERNPKAPKQAQQQQQAQEDDDDDDDGEETRRKRRRGKNKGRAASPDPWAVLVAKRDAPKFGDVVQAPPSLVKSPAVLHLRGIADVEGVPKAAGSLARREGLVTERKSVVEGYRKLMEGKRVGKSI